MKVIEMRVCYQHCIDWRQIAQAHARASQSLQDEDPLREIGIDYEVLSANLEKEARVTNEGYAQLIAARPFGACAECPYAA